MLASVVLSLVTRKQRTAMAASAMGRVATCGRARCRTQLGNRVLTRHPHSIDQDITTVTALDRMNPSCQFIAEVGPPVLGLVDVRNAVGHGLTVARRHSYLSSFAWCLSVRPSLLRGQASLSTISRGSDLACTCRYRRDSACVTTSFENG